MGAYKELDPDVVRKALEGQQDLLTPEVRKEEAFLRHCTCPNCNTSSFETMVNVRKPFSPGVALPNKILRCMGCRAEFDPYTRFIFKGPTAELG